MSKDRVNASLTENVRHTSPCSLTTTSSDQYIGDAEMFLEIWRVDTGALVARQSRSFRLDADSSDPESNANLSIAYPDAMVPGAVYSARMFTRVVGKTPWRRAIIDFRGQ